MAYHDGSPLSIERLRHGVMEVSGEIQGGGRLKNIDPTILKMSAEYSGIWEYKIDLRSQLGKCTVEPAVKIHCQK